MVWQKSGYVVWLYNICFRLQNVVPLQSQVRRQTRKRKTQVQPLKEKHYEH